MATIDDIINGTFNSLGRDVPFVPSPSTSEMYAGIIPRGNGMWGSNRPAMAAPGSYSPYMTANERAQLEQQIAQSKAMQATMGNTPKTMMASGPSWNDPTELDLAAIDKWDGGMSGDTGSMLAMFPDSPVNPAVAAATGAGNPVTNVQGAMLPRRSGGGFLEMLMGPSKNGMSGLPGLLGGPQQGGILQMLLGGDKSAAGLPRRAIPASAATDPRGFAIGEANRRNPNPTYNVSGDNNSFAPKSVQNSSRWQTGY